MQVTGNKKSGFENTMSIRLSPDGLYFWKGENFVAGDTACESAAIAGKRKVTENYIPLALLQNVGSAAELPRRIARELGGCRKLLYIDTKETVLVPEVLFDERSMNRIMHAASIFPPDNTQLLTSRCLCGVRALMYVDNAVCRVATLFPDSLTLSPLHYNLMKQQGSTERCTRIHLGKAAAYVSFFSASQPLFCEPVSYSGTDGLLYILSFLDEKFGCSAGPVYISGLESKKAVGRIKKYYPQTVCG